MVTLLSLALEPTLYSAFSTNNKVPGYHKPGVEDKYKKQWADTPSPYLSEPSRLVYYLYFLDTSALVLEGKC